MRQSAFTLYWVMKIDSKTEVVDPRRVRAISPGEVQPGPVIYWMSRDQRAHDNWALLYAHQLARSTGSPLVVLFCLVPKFLGATIRHYGFMLRGLAETATELGRYNIPFILRTGSPENEIPRAMKEFEAAALVTDFSPLRINRQWKQKAARRIGAPFYEVDAHNIVPCWIASPKLEYAAYTIRPKINRLLPEFLTDIPKLKRQRNNAVAAAEIDWEHRSDSLTVDRKVPEVDWCVPGERAARKTLGDFLKRRLERYDDARNDPTQDGQSGLSPYFHFGQLSAQRTALATLESGAAVPAEEAFLEELIVRRELSDNFCLYNPHYDSVKGFPNWAAMTLDDHRGDSRAYMYSPRHFERAQTHDELWNAAQLEMVHTGKMHGYMRMYWAKKILEWTSSPEEAMKIAIKLNDKYELDGRDPNGYAGIAWSIGGVHDRAWNEREIFGKIRYMSDGGCRRKFDVAAYIAAHVGETI